MWWRWKSPAYTWTITEKLPQLPAKNCTGVCLLQSNWFRKFLCFRIISAKMTCQRLQRRNVAMFLRDMIPVNLDVFRFSRAHFPKSDYPVRVEKITSAGRWPASKTRTFHQCLQKLQGHGYGLGTIPISDVRSEMWRWGSISTVQALLWRVMLNSSGPPGAKMNSIGGFWYTQSTITMSLWGSMVSSAWSMEKWLRSTVMWSERFFC